MPQKNHIAALQVLRCIAVLLVLLFHISGSIISASGIKFLGNIFSSGAAGVDLFFVISGFVIPYSSSQLLAKGRYSVYLRKRLIRIYPVYWLVVLLMVISLKIMKQPFRVVENMNLKDYISTLLLLPDHKTIDGVSWTLTFEVYFYLLFMLIALLKTRLFRSIFVLVLISVPPLAGTLHLGSYIYTSPFIYEFFLGAFIYFFCMSIKDKHHLILYAGFIGLILFMLLNTFHIINIDSPFKRVLFWGIPSFMIVMGSIHWNIKKSSISDQLFLIGDASYSIYLIQLPIIALMVKFLTKIPHKAIMINTGGTGVAIAIVCISVFFYLAVERKLLTYLQSGLNKPG